MRLNPLEVYSSKFGTEQFLPFQKEKGSSSNPIIFEGRAVKLRGCTPWVSWTSWPYQGIMMVHCNKAEYVFWGGGKGAGHWERMIPVDFHDM